MAVRLVHRQWWPHELRFGDRAGAVAYADRYGGGLARWDIVPAFPDAPRLGETRARRAITPASGR